MFNKLALLAARLLCALERDNKVAPRGGVCRRLKQRVHLRLDDGGGCGQAPGGPHRQLQQRTHLALDLLGLLLWAVVCSLS